MARFGLVWFGLVRVGLWSLGPVRFVLVGLILYELDGWLWGCKCVSSELGLSSGDFERGDEGLYTRNRHQNHKWRLLCFGYFFLCGG
jgi:hypothetical protein